MRIIGINKKTESEKIMTKTAIIYASIKTAFYSAKELSQLTGLSETRVRAVICELRARGINIVTENASYKVSE